MQLHQIEKFASYMRHAWSFLNRSTFIELVEAGECVRLQDAFELGQMPLRMFSLAIWRIGEPHGRRGLISRRPVVANIRPEAAGLGLTSSWRKHRHRRIVPVQLLCVEHVATQNLSYRCKQRRSLTDPAGQDGAFQLNPFACEDLRLTVQRSVVGELRRDDMRQQARSREATINHALWRRCLHHAGALPAAHLGANMADDEEARRHVLEHLRNVFTELAQFALTARALAVFGHVRPDFATQMRGESTALAARGCALNLLYLLDLYRRLSLYYARAQAEHQLVRVDRRLFRLRTILCASHLGELQFKMFDPVHLRDHQLAQRRCAHLF